MQLSEVYVMNMRTLKGIVRYEVTWDEWEMRRQASLAIQMEEPELKAFCKQRPLHAPSRVGCYVLEGGWGLPMQSVAHLVNVYEPLQG